MLLRGAGAISPLTKAAPFFAFSPQTQSSFFFFVAGTNFIHPPLLAFCRSFNTNNAATCFPHFFSLNRPSRLCTVSALAREPSSPAPLSLLTKQRAKKKARREAPENILHQKLCACSKVGDLAGALRLYDEARKNNVSLNVNHYNVLLYLCSSSKDDQGMAGLERGFEIFKQMGIDKVDPNEATFTNAARLACAKEDPEMAFDLIKKMKTCGISPKLRSYGPALFGFCKKLMADRAYEVDAHLIESGFLPDEPELSALLKLSSEVQRADKVYEIMHRLRVTVRQVSEETASIVEDWFKSPSAAEAGVNNWDIGKVKEGVLKGGGGWHGQGWLGSGNWRVERTEVDQKGVCRSCNEKLICIDIEPKETENFAKSLATLACEREVKHDFMKFQEWLRRHGPYDAVVDGANVALISHHNFSFFGLKTVVDTLRQMSPSSRFPLIILHKNRLTDAPAQHPNNQMLLEVWKNAGAFYSTPCGSNDDWYWLYAAVSCKCLLVTNDEMRDHLFQLLGTSFFPRWKEKHQVRVKLSRDGISFRMPPPYSIVIQESEQGSWHVPTVVGDDLDTPRQWVCATRLRQ